MGLIAVKMFPSAIDSLNHDAVNEFRELLEGMAGAYRCTMTSFAIKKGVVFVSFDKEEIVQDILADLEELTGQRPTMCDSAESFIDDAKQMIE